MIRRPYTHTSFAFSPFDAGHDSFSLKMLWKVTKGDALGGVSAPLQCAVYSSNYYSVLRTVDFVSYHKMLFLGPLVNENG
jgi:hypothetical protein